MNEPTQIIEPPAANEPPIAEDLPKPRELTPSEKRRMERYNKHGIDKQTVMRFYTVLAHDSRRLGPCVNLNRARPGKAAVKAAKRERQRMRSGACP